MGKRASSCKSSNFQQDPVFVKEQPFFIISVPVFVQRLKDVMVCETVSHMLSQAPVACSRLGGVSTGCRKITVCSKVTVTVALCDGQSFLYLTESQRILLTSHSVSRLCVYYCLFKVFKKKKKNNY